MTTFPHWLGVLTISAMLAATPAAAEPPSPREALEALYHSTDGDNWHRNDGWLDDDVHWCDWYGVECGEDNDGDLFFARLELTDNNLGGELPADLARFNANHQLPRSVLDLSHNAIGGTLAELPTGSAQLRLSNNLLSGPLPERHASTPWRLGRLALDNNRFEGGVPDSWTPLRLRYLDLSDNELDSDIGNAFSALRGALTMGFGTAFIDLSGNRYSGELPPGPVMRTHFAAFAGENGGRLDLCWNDLTISDDEFDEWLRDRHVGGPGYDYRQCLGRERQALDLSVSGSWFAPQRSGEGVTLHTTDSGIPVLYWFTFDREGNQQWMFGTGHALENHLRWPELMESRGHFGQGFIYRFSGEPRMRRTGQIRMHRTGQNEMNVTRIYTLHCVPLEPVPFVSVPCISSHTSDRHDHRQLTRLGGTRCDAQEDRHRYSGVWHNREVEGEGLVVEATDTGEGHVYWFTYRGDGSALQAWMTGTGQWHGNTLYIDHLLQPLGGSLGPAFNPAAIQRLHWGTLTLTFDDEDSGHAWYNSVLGEYGSGNFPLERLTRAKLAECE